MRHWRLLLGLGVMLAAAAGLLQIEWYALTERDAWIAGAADAEVAVRESRALYLENGPTSRPIVTLDEVTGLPHRGWLHDGDGAQSKAYAASYNATVARARASGRLKDQLWRHERQRGLYREAKERVRGSEITLGAGDPDLDCSTSEFSIHPTHVGEFEIYKSEQFTGESLPCTGPIRIAFEDEGRTVLIGPANGTDWYTRNLPMIYDLPIAAWIPPRSSKAPDPWVRPRR